MKIVRKKVTAAKGDDVRERYAQRRANAKEKKSAAKSELMADIRKAESSEDPIEELFELLVPSSGPSQYAGGEIVRAMMRILYRDYNDGDVFYDGYGIETCADAVAFLCDKFPDLEIMFEKIAQRTLQDDYYTNAIKDIADVVAKKIIANPQNFVGANKDDYLKYDGKEFLEEREWIPEYDIDVTMPDNVYYHLEEGDVDERDLQDDIESWDIFYKLDEATVSIENGYVCFEHLDRESYDEISEYGYRWLESIGDDWDEEFGSEEDRMDDEDEDEEE